MVLPAGTGLMILFHPSNSPALGQAIGKNCTKNPTTFDRNVANIYDYRAGHKMFDSAGIEHAFDDASFAEMIGDPESLLTAHARCTGGVMTIKISGCNGSSGFLVSSNPLLSELANPQKLYSDHASSVRLKHHTVGDGSRDFCFNAPPVNEAALSLFTDVNDRFSWGIEDPFGGIVVTIHDLSYNSNLGTPFIVEVDMQVGIQCWLPIEDRHFATSHGTESAAAKHALHSSSDAGHVSTGSGASSEVLQHSAATSPVATR